MRAGGATADKWNPVTRVLRKYVGTDIWDVLLTCPIETIRSKPLNEKTYFKECDVKICSWMNPADKLFMYVFTVIWSRKEQSRKPQGEQSRKSKHKPNKEVSWSSLTTSWICALVNDCTKIYLYALVLLCSWIIGVKWLTIDTLRK